jgi:hypothetical protein
VDFLLGTEEFDIQNYALEAENSIIKLAALCFNVILNVNFLN